ncbi:asparagine synthase (glutamine-hydrolyzing) [Magnetospirillum moscoviense]|uniref:asparagine synthase (glutamine-hydrolyzing) n=1 Tax=Magnetospirillum moscoviense TaxID=1437059 RepID=A0A178MYQ5_9PROT|nr:asparagine synthase (glutamine-hydrolyzing) [Magnetospirillum moscoviense]OAN55155.1 asparagine synthetase B [Magnetospirillum moscoviense]
MCGLAAILAGAGASRPVDADELVRIRDAMTARGPDGRGLWLSPDGRVGLAHRRLAIIDLSPAGAQPMASTCGGYRIVFNGEIYNYRALRAELEAEGVTFRSHTDTEVILELYRRDGMAMLERLRGMFALALWDQARQGMLLARDPFGIKPLYVADDGSTLRAASQVKALLAGGAIDTRPDPAGHVGFFLWGHVPEPHTLYDRIKPVAAGSWIWAGSDGTRRYGQFFDLRAEFGRPAGPAGASLREALLDSVRHHLEADVPVGVFLSSGLDSATLTACTRELTETLPHTVTLGFREFAGGPRDETPLAERIAAHYGTHHRTIHITAADFAAHRERIIADMDQPSVDGVNTWFVARAARECGLKVALSGLGGDELFGGYDSFRQLPRLVAAMAPLRHVSGLGRMVRRMTAPWIGRFASPKAAGLLEYGTSFGDAYLLRRGLHMPWELAGVMDPEMARIGWRDLQARAALAAAAADIAGDRRKVSALEMGFYMRNQLLRDADWAGMAHSLEIRVPLVDVELFRTVVALAGDGQGPGKQDMAACSVPALPHEVLNRPKSGFFVPVAQWLGERTLKGWAARVYDAFAA